ncbi:MAG TPA: hypothetical protein VMZ03_11375 [Chitinophagaceae bacterium]|nr:hypothetical protein [Chitinophagaceae bacterium]
MKRPLILLLLLFAVGFVEAQYNWNIVLQKKILLKGNEVNEEKNVRVVKSSDWKKSGYLEVYFREEHPSRWKHTIRFTDELGTEMMIKENVFSTKISTTSLRKTFAGKKQVKIYMVIAPADPNIMAPARMIHLATLKLP